MSVQLSMQLRTANVYFDFPTTEAMQCVRSETPEQHAAFVEQEIRSVCGDHCSFTVETQRVGVLTLGCTACRIECFRGHAADVSESLRDLTAKHLAARENAYAAMKERFGNPFELLYRRMLESAIPPKTPSEAARARAEREGFRTVRDVNPSIRYL